MLSVLSDYLQRPDAGQISPASFSSDLLEAVFPPELSGLQSGGPRSLRPCSQDSSLDARSLENLGNGNRRLSGGWDLPSGCSSRTDNLDPRFWVREGQDPPHLGRPLEPRGQPDLPSHAQPIAQGQSGSH